MSVSITAGAILAVLAVYGSRVAQMTGGVIGRDSEGRTLLINILIAFVPAAVIGLLAGGAIKSYLFNLHVVAGSWALWGIAASP